MDIIITPYSEKSFKVGGESTKLFTQQLKDLGGKFNRNLKDGPGWIYPNTKLESLQTFVEQVKGGQVEVQPLSPRYNQKTIPIPLPQKPKVISKYQQVIYNVYKPTKNMPFKVVNPGIHESKEYLIHDVEDHNGIIDTVFAKSKDADENIQLVIINGKWKIFRKCEEHNIMFDE